MLQGALREINGASHPMEHANRLRSKLKDAPIRHAEELSGVD